MKILISRDIQLNPLRQILTFDDGTQETDLGATQVTPILTAEQRNGKAARTDDGRWVAAPGARTTYDWDTNLLGFRVELHYQGRDADDKTVYDYRVTTPTGVAFYGDGEFNVLRVPPHWAMMRVAAEAIWWICLGEDEISDHAKFTPAQQAWVDSSEREEYELEINDWLEVYDRGMRAPEAMLETAHLGDSDKIAAAAERYISQNILWNQTALVNFILGQDGNEHMTWDDVENLYPDPDNMSALEAFSYIVDQMGMPAEDFMPSWDSPTSPADPGKLAESDFSTGDADELREYIRDNAQPHEVYEWWLINEWLHGQLREIGEVVLSDGWNYWWGRTVTGQAIILDGTIQRIAAKWIEYL